MYIYIYIYIYTHINSPPPMRRAAHAQPPPVTQTHVPAHSRATLIGWSNNHFYDLHIKISPETSKQYVQVSNTQQLSS